MPFNTFEELSDYIRTEKKELIDVIIEVENNLQGTAPRIFCVGRQNIGLL